MTGRKIVRCDIPKFTFGILVVDKFFAPVFQAAGNRNWPGTKIDKGSAGGDMPSEHAGSNVFPLDRSQRIIELLIKIAGISFVDERVEELADMTW
jgi:hypothetical protein